MKALKAILQFFCPWPIFQDKKIPREPYTFPYWKQIHHGLQGASAVIFWLLVMVTWNWPIFDFFHKHVIHYIFPQYFVLHWIVLFTGALVIGGYYTFLWWRLYKLMWRHLDPWFESKYKKPKKEVDPCPTT
jgi:hypothetical protein